MTLRRLVALDLEPTGFNVYRDRIVEFCFIELDADLCELGRWTRRVNPGVPIPAAATAVHGIRDADVVHLPTLESHAARIQGLLDGATVIAYNADFDLMVLHHELRRCGQAGFAVNHPRRDPYRIYRAEVPDQYRLTGAVRHYLGRPHVGAHGTEADALATVDVYRAQIGARLCREVNLSTPLSPSGV